MLAYGTWQQYADNLVSLPGALGMYGLSLGIHNIGDRLPAPVYALITGLNAATVGIIALAGVQLADKTITDKLTRILVFFGGTAGMLYSKLWYFPVLLAAGAVATFVWDQRWLQKYYAKLRLRFKPNAVEAEQHQTNADEERNIELTTMASTGTHTPATTADTAELAKLQPSHNTRTSIRSIPQSIAVSNSHSVNHTDTTTRTIPSTHTLNVLTWRRGAFILVLTLALLVIVIILRSTLTNPPFALSLFNNFFLAGTIIFGGGPVVTPLLREYVVGPGWVSSRDFLLGLAIINAFPGPNFNFAVYLGSLAALGGGVPSYAGALLAYLGIFAPGLATISGAMGIWSILRSKPWLKSVLRGVNAVAVGLVFTAVYRLWQVGVLDGTAGVSDGQGGGRPLGSDPWWVVVTATSFVGGRWFGVNAVSAILLGSLMGIIWWAIVET